AGSLSEESLDSRVYLGNPLFHQYLIVLFDDAYRKQYSCSCAESAEKVCACRDCANDDSTDNGYRWYVAVEDLSYRGAGASESFDLHSGVDQLLRDCLRIHAAYLDPCDREEDAG